MAFFDDLVQKTKDFGDITKLNSAVSDEEKKLNACYQQLGVKYVELFGNAPQPELSGFVNTIKQNQANIAKYKEQINALKGLVPCPKCGTALAAGSAFCVTCGSPVAQATQPAAANTCKNCGKPLADGVRFCTGCGTPVSAVAPAEPVATEPVAAFDPYATVVQFQPEMPAQPVAATETAHCVNCGAPLSEGVSFCTGCGFPVSSAPATEPIPQPEIVVAPVAAPVTEPEIPVAPVVEPAAEPEIPVAPVVKPVAEPEIPVAPVAEPTPKNLCATCGNPLDDGVRFCTFCGTPVPAPAVPNTKKCPNCGAEAAATNSFCIECGTKL